MDLMNGALGDPMRLTLAPSCYETRTERHKAIETPNLVFVNCDVSGKETDKI